jgi:kinetochore protein Spc25
MSLSRSVRIPQIDLAAVLADPNPHIDLKIQAYETSTRNFLKAVANYKTRTIATIADRRAKHAVEMKRALEKIAAAEVETNQCKMKEIQLVAGRCVSSFCISGARLIPCRLLRLAEGGGGAEGG